MSAQISSSSVAKEMRPFHDIPWSSKQQNEPRGKEGTRENERVERAKERVFEKSHYSHENSSGESRTFSRERSDRSSRSHWDSRYQKRSRENERVERAKERVFEKSRHSYDDNYGARS